jgi:hypothetical protein
MRRLTQPQLNGSNQVPQVPRVALALLGRLFPHHRTCSESDQHRSLSLWRRVICSSIRRLLESWALVCKAVVCFWASGFKGSRRLLKDASAKLLAFAPSRDRVKSIFRAVNTVPVLPARPCAACWNMALPAYSHCCLQVPRYDS